MTAAPLLLVLALAQGPLDVEVVRPEAGPEVVVHRLDAPLVALRLSAPVPPSFPEGAVELLQELVRGDARAAADAVGARLALRREPGRAVFSVVGRADAFDALAAVLRRAAGELDLTASNLLRSRARAESRLLAALEQPEPRVRRALWHRLNGGAAPAMTAARPGPEEIRELQARLYHPAELRVTVVGDVPLEVAAAAFSSWPGGSTPAPLVPLPDDSGRTAVRPQRHREWAGLGYPAGDDAAVAAVAAEMIRERLDRSSLGTGTAESWPLGDRWALVLIGSAEPGDPTVRAVARVGDLPVEGEVPEQAPMDVGRYLRRAIAEAAALAGSDAVAEARARLKRRLMVAARTVSGRAEVIGGLSDAVGPEQLSTFLAALERVGLGEVRALLRDVLARPALLVDGG